MTLRGALGGRQIGQVLGIRGSAVREGPDQSWVVGYNGATTSVVVSDGAAIQDLADDAFTAETWVRSDSYGEGTAAYLINKWASAAGWYIRWRLGTGIEARVECATTDALSRIVTNIPDDGKWHHVAMFFDDAGDRKIHVEIDGVWQSYATQTAGVGAISSDIGDDLYIGNRADNGRTFDGEIGWTRISDNDRYNHGVDFTPPATMPAVDGNAVVQYGFDEGAGTNLDNETGDAFYDGTLANGTWEAH